MSLSEYEKQRLANIKENEALLRTLDIPTVTRKTTTNNKTTKQHKPAPKKKEPQLPTRTSARIRGEKPLPLKRSLELDAANSLDEGKKQKTIDSLDTEEQAKLLGIFKTTLVPNTKPKHEEIKQEKNDDGKTPDEVLTEQLSNLEIRHTWATVKVVPSRINCCLFHPSDSKLLGCAADIDGHLGFWDIENEDEEGEPVTYKYKPHKRTITDLLFNPADHSKLMTSSYDGLIRTFDMNKAEFTSWDYESEKYPLSSFDLSQDGHTIWFSTSDGDVGMKDARERGAPTVRTASEKKVGCVHLNPVHQHLLAGASNDRQVHVWDTRMWSKKELKNELNPLHSFEHGYSATSAYWSPNGDILASTSYDDYVRLFSFDKKDQSMELKSAIPHNNHTGRWITNFRARWSTNGLNGLKTQYFSIGNMKQPIDIYSGESGNEIVQLYDDDHITAIPSVSRFHPNTITPTLLAGNASGRMVCWTSSSGSTKE